jgi:hypothetical protein
MRLDRRCELQLQRADKLALSGKRGGGLVRMSQSRQRLSQGATARAAARA